MKSIILTWEKFQDHEVIYPYYRLQEEGPTHIVSNFRGKIFGILGTHVPSKGTISELELYEDWDMLVLPGGVKALEKLRQDTRAIDFIQAWDKDGKTIASICHGGQLLVEADIIRSRDCSGYYSIKTDMENAGGHYVNAPVTVAGNLICCPHYDFMHTWLKTAIDKHYELQGQDSKETVGS